VAEVAQGEFLVGKVTPRAKVSADARKRSVCVAILGEKASERERYLLPCADCTKGTVTTYRCSFVMAWSVIHAHWLIEKEATGRDPQGTLGRKNSVLLK